MCCGFPPLSANLIAMSTKNTSEIALITGAADRIGAEIARALAEAGHAVIVHYNRSADAAQKLVSEITATDGRAALVGADLCEPQERDRLVADAAEKFGPLTTLINNASLFEPDSVETLDEALWDRHFDVHTKAPAFLARDFAAQIPAGRTGNIINIIDERVLHLAPAYFSYTLSKSALWTATRTMAQSLAPNIRVNAIGPGPTLPASGQSDSDLQKAQRSLPLQRGATPEDIAAAVLFLLGAPSITGQMLALDGGRHLSWSEKRGSTPRQK